jgi:hypothetical protein
MTNAKLRLVAILLGLGLGIALALPPRLVQADPPAAGGEAAPAADGGGAPAPSAASAAPAPAASSSAASSGSASAAAPASAPAADAKTAALRNELGALMDDLVAARARAAVLGQTLFKTRIALRLQNLAGPDPVLAKITLSLDGAPVFHGDASALTGDEARGVFEGFAAPGPHLLVVEVEQRSRDNAAYGYTLHESYRFEATRDKETELTLVLDDDSDLASDFPDDGEGKYDVRTRLRVKTHALGNKR